MRRLATATATYLINYTTPPPPALGPWPTDEIILRITVTVGLCTKITGGPKHSVVRYFIKQTQLFVSLISSECFIQILDTQNNSKIIYTITKSFNNCSGSINYFFFYTILCIKIIRNCYYQFFFIHMSR